MKKLLIVFFFLALPLAAFAQSGLLDRYTDPEKGPVVFIGKGMRDMGISGSYRSFQVGGDNLLDDDGFQILSFLQIGNGQMKIYKASVGASLFVADDTSLGLQLGYSGYNINSDLHLGILELLNRHMHNNAWTVSLTGRKYMSFFGSKTFGVFGEARLFGKYARTESCPIVDVTESVPVTVDGKVVYNDDGTPKTKEQPTGETRWAVEKNRISNAYSAGLKLGGGLAVRLRDNSILTVSVPVVGVAYTHSHQDHVQTGNASHINSFTLSRDIDKLAIQIGYTRLIEPKKKK